jgi:predicted TIM-barrel fold metal-dependent hydrolase
MTRSDSQQGPIYDVHIHYVPGWWYESVEGAAAPIHRDISNLDIVLAGADDGEGSKRVLSASVEILYGGKQRVDPEKLRRVSDSIAEAVSDHGDSLLGFGTVNAFGEGAGDEVRYAIEELGLSGIIVDSVRDGIRIGDPATHSTLEAAAELGVPVFVHPVWTPDVDSVTAAAGHKAAGFGRGYQTGLALLQILHERVYESISGLKLIFTALGVGSLFFAHEGLAELQTELGGAPGLYFDTTSLHPASVRYALEVLGPERIIVGTDWPFHDDDRQAIRDSVGRLGLSEQEEEAVLRGNFAGLFASTAARS